MVERNAESRRLARGIHCGVRMAACAALIVAACAQPPDEPPGTDEPPEKEERAEVKMGTIEPKKTEGAPYPPAEPDDRVPNVEDEERWVPVPDGPAQGDMQPANPPVEVEEVGPDRYPKDEDTKDEEGSR